MIGGSLRANYQHQLRPTINPIVQIEWPVLKGSTNTFATDFSQSTALNRVLNLILGFAVAGSV